MSTLTLRNQFEVTSIDLDTFDFPEPTVQSWTPLFGKAERSVTIEAKTPEGHRLTLWRHEGDDVRFWRKEATKRLAEWNEDNRGNWLRLISGAMKDVHDFNVRQAREYAAEKRKSAAALKRLGELEAVAS